MNYIQRSIETRLLQAMKAYKAVLVTGPRQAGKSTLLKQLFPARKYVSLDDPFLEEQANQNGSTFMMLNQPPITIDEAQRAPMLFRYIKMRCDESEEKGLFCLSGSQQFRLMKNVSETLAGRVSILELPGLSLRELQGDPFALPFLPTMEYLLERQKTVKTPKNLWQIIHRGSYPALQDPDLEWAAFYADYVRTYIERDVRELSAVHDLDAFRRFMVAAAARTGSVLNCSNIASEVGKDLATIKNWLSILEASGIVYLLEPYASTALKRAIRAPKLYFRDTGLVCYLTRWLTDETLAYGAMNGPIFETFVISEILKSFSNAGLDYRYFASYYRGKDKIQRQKDGESMEIDGEIDLILEENGVLYPIEIKTASRASADMSAAFQVLNKIPEKQRGMGAVVCLCPQPGQLRENVLQIPAWYI